MKSSPAHIFNYSTAIVSKDLSLYHFGDEPEIVNMVSNTSIFAIYDNTRVLIQNINLDHQTFGVLTVSDFTRPGANATCTDLALYEKTNRLYLVCQTDVNQEHHEAMWLVELDATTGATLNVLLQQ